MLNHLRNLFSKSKSATGELAAGREDFLQQLGTSDILIFAAMQNDGIDPNGLTQEQLLQEIRRAAKDLKERQGFAPFVYEAGGERRLPFFTSNDHVQKFVGDYSKQRNRVYSFQWLSIKGSLLAKLLPACDVLVMNDRSEDEEIFSDGDVKLIRRMWGSR